MFIVLGVRFSIFLHAERQLRRGSMGSRMLRCCVTSGVGHSIRSIPVYNYNEEDGTEALCYTRYPVSNYMYKDIGCFVFWGCTHWIFDMVCFLASLNNIESIFVH